MSTQPNEDLSTEHVELEELELAHNHLELRIVQEGQREFRFPFFEEEMLLQDVAAKAFPGGAPWKVKLADESVILTHQETQKSHHLEVGESVLIEGRRIYLVDVRKPPVANLEGVNEPFVGQVWHIKSHQAWVGRKGKRLNHIELNHPTISRTHATFLPEHSGRVNLLAEASGSPTTINGQAVEAGETSALSNGDLVGFGKLLFRFSGSSNTDDQTRLYLQTLGEFRLTLGSESGKRVEIKNEKARNLFALLATTWGRPIPVERIIEDFWPDVQLTRGRKNLSYSLSQLKDALKSVELDLESVLDRSPSELKLRTDCLGRHDYTEVEKLVKTQGALTSSSGLSRLLKLSGASFLPANYENWASERRETLESNVVATLLATARHHLHDGEVGLVDLACEELLEKDNLHEEATQLIMEAALKNAQPEVAVKVFENLERSLKNEGLEPSIELVKLFHRARLGL